MDTNNDNVNTSHPADAVYTISSIYRNNAKIVYNDDSEPMFDHEITETYRGVDEGHVELLVARLMDVDVGIPEPTLNDEMQNNIPENVRNSIFEHYKTRYAEFCEFMRCLKDEMFGDGEIVERVFVVGSDGVFDNENSKMVSSKIIVTKSV